MLRERFFAEDGACILLARVESFLASRGIIGYLVGGLVRDGLMGRATRDLDLAVPGDALALAREAAAALGGRYVPLDEVNQVARVVVAHAEASWYLDFASMRGSIEEDLAQRDFTIDAMAIPLKAVAPGWSLVPLVDPRGGLADLGAGLVRVVRHEAFHQDAARLLRAYRLAAQLGFTIEGNTEDLIRRDHALIVSVAAERVRDELCGVLAVSASAPWLRRLDGVGLLGIIIPELEATKGVEQPKEHFWDVFEHSLETVAALERLTSRPFDRQFDKLTTTPRTAPSDEVLRLVPWSGPLARHFQGETSGGRTRLVLLKLAALLHDLGKPVMKHFDENGRMRFIGHAREGAALVTSIMQRLRFSSREVGMVERMVAYHLRPGQMANQGLPTHRAIYRYFRDAGEEGIDILFLGLADHLATRGPRLSLPEWEEHVQRVDYILARYFDAESAVRPAKLIDGHDVMRALGLSPGPYLGQLLEEVREAQAAGEVKTKEEALAYLKERFGRERCAGEMRLS